MQSLVTQTLMPMPSSPHKVGISGGREISAVCFVYPLKRAQNDLCGTLGPQVIVAIDSNRRSDEPSSPVRIHKRISKGLVLVLMAVTTLTCQDYPFERQCAEQINEVKTSAIVSQSIPVDILFVVDNSASMADEQENLVRNFASFIDVLSQSELNYRVGVVTTDVGDDQVDLNKFDRDGDLVRTVDETNNYRPVSFVDDNSCQPIGNTQVGCLRSPRPTSRWIDNESDSADEVQNVFAQAARVGTCGSGRERGTTAIIAALERTTPGDCNDGFLRDEANLVVIVLSDEDAYIEDGPAYPASAEQFVSRLGQLKDISRVRLAIIGAFIDGLPASCRVGEDSQPTQSCGSLCLEPPLEGSEAFWGAANISGVGCDSCSSFDVADCCAADVGAQVYYDFALAIEAAVKESDPDIDISECRGEGRPACLVDSICQAEFAQTLNQIARDLVVSTGIQISPPAEYPEGVRARLVEGEQIRELEFGVDFTVNSSGTLFTLITQPDTNEELEIFTSNVVRPPDDTDCLLEP